MCEMSASTEQRVENIPISATRGQLYCSLSQKEDIHELTGIFVFECLRPKNLLSTIANDVNFDVREVRTRGLHPDERSSKFLCFIYRSALESLLSV